MNAVKLLDLLRTHTLLKFCNEDSFSRQSVAARLAVRSHASYNQLQTCKNLTIFRPVSYHSQNEALYVSHRSRRFSPVGEGLHGILVADVLLEAGDEVRLLDTVVVVDPAHRAGESVMTTSLVPPYSPHTVY